MSQATLDRITRSVVKHYQRHKRDLPWRQTSDSYPIWISEIMLQQTRVATVIPYYLAWLQRFPTIEALAKAPLDDVLAMWSGLGYYSRARNIHRCAQEVCEDYAGRLPSAAAELRKLPGIGRYTAGAISSIAYGQQEPLVDGNVARVLCRVFEITESIKSTATTKRLWQLCSDLVPAKEPGDFNQGLMELGALICTPKQPACKDCPIGSNCGAHRNNRTEVLPITTPRQADADKPLLSSQAAFLVRRNKLLLAKRKPKGLYGGLWELPQAEHRLDLETLTGLSLCFAQAPPSIEHAQVLSHRRLRIQVWAAQATGRTRLAAQSTYDELAWHSFETLRRLGISSATKAIVERRSEI